MKNNMRKTVALLLAIVFTLALLATGCGNDAPASTPGTPNTPSNSDKPAAAPDEQSFYIGTNCWGAGVPILDAELACRTYALELFGCEVNSSSDDFTADKELQNAQNMVSAGVKGVCFQGGAPNVIPQAAAMFKENGIPFTIDSQVGTDDILTPLAQNNEYYLGAVEPDCTQQGEQLAQLAADDGCRKAIIVGGNIGDVNMDQRVDGFTRVFEAAGGEVVAVGRCTDQSECATKMEDMLSANRDADCVYMMVGDYVAGTLSAVGNLGLSPNLYVSCVDEDSAKYIKDGTLTAGNDGMLLPTMVAPTLLMNYMIHGVKLTDENGLAAHYLMPSFVVNSENVDLYLEVFCSDDHYAMSEELLKSMVSEDMTYEKFCETINNLGLDVLAGYLGIE